MLLTNTAEPAALHLLFGVRCSKKRRRFGVRELGFGELNDESLITQSIIEDFCIKKCRVGRWQAAVAKYPLPLCSARARGEG